MAFLELAISSLFDWHLATLFSPIFRFQLGPFVLMHGFPFAV